MDIQVDIKQAIKETRKLRSRFVKVQRTIFGDALKEAGAPIVQSAKAKAPRRSGRLQLRLQALNPKMWKGRLGIAITPARRSKNDPDFPFYGRFIEFGWKHVGTAPRGSSRKFKQISGKHFLRNAGSNNFSTAERLFAARTFAGLKELEAGASSGE